MRRISGRCQRGSPYALWAIGEAMTKEKDRRQRKNPSAVCLAAKIANELRNKRPEHFVDKAAMADMHAALERAADVLGMVKGSQARRSRQRRR